MVYKITYTEYSTFKHYTVNASTNSPKQIIKDATEAGKEVKHQESELEEVQSPDQEARSRLQRRILLK